VNYFSACLRILGLDEEVAVTEQTLKAAYKKAVIRVHPDKGGSEKEFEAVTRAYAYLGDILRRIHGGRTKESVVEAPTVLASGRGQDAEAWKMVEPVTLNPAKLDMNTFNTMFEKTRIPDPDETGYGDWLKGGDSSGGAAGAAGKQTFGGKFNRDVFHKAFEDEQRTRTPSNKSTSMVTQELSLSSRMGYGVELGRSGRDDYTVAPNENGLHFTDLKKAYTTYNTFSQETTGVNIEARSVDAYTAERKKAPRPLTDHEMSALHAAEKAMATAEEQRKLRMAQEAINEDSYFERMKRLVIRN
jgi:curved DNA-binding protein CbpA